MKEERNGRTHVKEDEEERAMTSRRTRRVKRMEEIEEGRRERQRNKVITPGRSEAKTLPLEIRQRNGAITRGTIKAKEESNNSRKKR